MPAEVHAETREQSATYSIAQRLQQVASPIIYRPMPRPQDQRCKKGGMKEREAKLQTAGLHQMTWTSKMRADLFKRTIAHNSSPHWLQPGNYAVGRVATMSHLQRCCPISCIIERMPHSSASSINILQCITQSNVHHASHSEHTRKPSHKVARETTPRSALKPSKPI